MAISATSSGGRSVRYPVQRTHWGVRALKVFGSDRARFLAFLAFAGLVAITGGSSRADVSSLIFLRPVAVLALIYSLSLVTSKQIFLLKAPLFFLIAILVVALGQLVPLPPGLWADLPQRQGVIADFDGLGGISRPLSFDPARTWNAFFSLFVPLATICLVAVQGVKFRRWLVPVLMMIALLSVILGYLQAVGARDLHFYEITHKGFPVGFFANKNHQAVMLLWLMLAISWFAATTTSRRVSAGMAVGGALAAILVFFPLLVLTGSRAGLLLSPIALLLCGWLLWRSPAAKRVLRIAGKRAKVLLSVTAVCLAVPLMFVFAVLSSSGRQTALSRLFELDAADDLRWQHTPIFLRMVEDFMPLGSGFGSFEGVFKMYEPSATLSSRYMNQAHNDFLQVAIEGGLPAVVIFVAALAWYLLRCWRLWRSRQTADRGHAIFFVGSLLLWLGASVVDYPLRTPLAAMLVAALTAQLSILSTSIRPGGGVLGKQSQADLP